VHEIQTSQLLLNADVSSQITHNRRPFSPIQPHFCATTSIPTTLLPYLRKLRRAFNADAVTILNVSMSKANRIAHIARLAYRYKEDTQRILGVDAAQPGELLNIEDMQDLLDEIAGDGALEMKEVVELMEAAFPTSFGH